MIHVTSSRGLRYIKVILVLEQKILAKEFVDE